MKKPATKTAPKRAEPEKIKPGREVATLPKGSLPAALAARMSADAGKGVSTSQDDNLVPIITILQDMSPQTKRRDPKYMDGAEPGVIWLKNAEDPLVAAEDGFLFQPCHFDKDYVEWVPRDSGGGFVTRHRAIPKEARKVEDPKNKNKVKWVMSNGNEIIETRYHTGFVIRDGLPPTAYVIPLSSSGHTVSRDWMFRMNNVSLPDGSKAPSFAKLYTLKTKLKTNSVGQSWYIFDVAEAGWVETEEDYERGLGLFNAFEGGEKKMDDSGLGDTQEPATGDDRM